MLRESANFASLHGYVLPNGVRLAYSAGGGEDKH